MKEDRTNIHLGVKIVKKIILGSLSILFLSVPLASVARAEVSSGLHKGEAHCATTSSSSTQIDPFRLVYRAYEGSFDAQGIPGGSLLLDAIALRRVTAEQIVESAIEQGRLSPDTINDQSYLKAVEFQMRGLASRD